MSQKAIATVSASVTVSVKLWYFVHCLNLLIHHKTGIVFHFYLFSLVIKLEDTKKWAFRVVVMCNGMQLVFNTKGLFVSWWGMELMRWVKEKVKWEHCLPVSAHLSAAVLQDDVHVVIVFKVADELHHISMLEVSLQVHLTEDLQDIRHLAMFYIQQQLNTKYARSKIKCMT